jgi:putative Holliday junction resolvase
MNILALDYGEKRIGLAWSDTGIRVVLPFGVVKNQEASIMYKELGKMVASEKIDLVVVGLPLSLDGSENKNTERIRKFVEDLKMEIDVPVEFFDERFSSQQADAMGAGVSRDEKSAMVILESFLEQRKNKNSK